MKKQSKFSQITSLIEAVALLLAPAALAIGIPEPGLVVYGIVSNVNLAATSSTPLLWTNRSANELVIAPAKWVAVNDKLFYVATIPFETRFTGNGITVEWASPPGKSYGIMRSTKLEDGFALLQKGIQGDGGVARFHDPSATGLGPYFYRIYLE